MQKSKVKISAWKWQVPRVDKRSARMRSDSVKNMSACADQNHAPSLTDVRLEFLLKIEIRKRNLILSLCEMESLKV